MRTYFIQVRVYREHSYFSRFHRELEPILSMLSLLESIAFIFLSNNRKFETTNRFESTCKILNLIAKSEKLKVSSNSYIRFKDARTFRKQVIFLLRVFREGDECNCRNASQPTVNHSITQALLANISKM